MVSAVLTRHSLKTRIALTTLVIFLASLWTLSFVASQILRKDMERLLGEQQFSTVSIVAAQINNELILRFDALNRVAETLAPFMQDSKALQASLELRPITYSLFNGGAVVYRTDNIAIAEIPATGRVGVNYTDRDSVVAANNEGKASIGRPVQSQQMSAPVFLMTVPIRDAHGKVIGALSGVVNLAQPNFLDQVTENRYGKTGGYVLLIPKSRLIVTATDKSRIMQNLPSPGVNPPLDRFLAGFEGSAVYTNPLNVEVLGSAKRIPLSDWLLGLTLPTEEAFSPIHDMQQHMLWAALLLTCLATALSWGVMRRQLLPIFSTQ